MKHFIRSCIDRLPYIRDLREEVRREGRFPAGHYYSPIPSEDEVRAHLNSREPYPSDLPDVDLQTDGQLALLTDYSRFYPDISFPSTQQAQFRYYYPNYLFDYADAFFLYSFLRKYLPARIMEIGSGFSSAVMLDTADRLTDYHPQITMIEPNPSRLYRMISERDRSRVKIFPKRLQEVDLQLICSLDYGDLLFVDSSHVMKCGSDVHALFTKIVPMINPGVFVHFHDIFYPFDYPKRWFNLGFYYNEAYCLREFLAYNNVWAVHFWTSYVDFAFGDFIKKHMPLCSESPGSSLYIRKQSSPVR